MAYIIDGGGYDNLYSLYLQSRSIGARFSNIAWEVKDFPILGPMLQVGLGKVASLCYGASYIIIDFADFYYDVIGAIKALLRGESFRDILDLLFPPWYDLAHNPLAYLLDLLGLDYPHTYNLFRAPGMWIRSYFDDAFPMAWVLFNNPQEWLDQVLFNFSPLLWGLYTDGIEYVVEVIYQLYPDTRWVFDDPIEWLRLQLHRMTDIPWEWLTDPTGNLLELVLNQLENTFKTSKITLLRVGEKVLRYLWEGV